MDFSADDISDEGNADQIKTVFQNDQGKKTIDVYWIADDGGEFCRVVINRVLGLIDEIKPQFLISFTRLKFSVTP